MRDDILIEADADTDESVIPAGSGQSRKISTKEVDREIRSFCEDSEDGTLILQPDFQRHFIWSAAKSSRLIESALMEVPLPAVYLFEEPNGKISVIDGQQRLTAFISFVRGSFLHSNKPFALSGLNALEHLNGEKFSSLSREEQRKIRGTNIRTITFKKESDPDLKFDVFERLNAESTSLNAQELRNCVYRGPYNDLLKELSEFPDFRRLMGISAPHKRMRDVEYVLRFAAFYHKPYSSPIKRFLNQDMEENRNISETDARKLREAFRKTVRIIRTLLGDKACRRFVPGTEKEPGGHWETKQLNASLYDVLMWQFAQGDMDGNLVHRHLDSLREGLIHLMAQDEEFRNSIMLATSDNRVVRKRFDKFRAMVSAAIGDDRKQPRCFSRKLKQEMYSADPTCNICGNRIADIDDAAVDHIVEYWAGGKTIPENARLAHRYCNWARGRETPVAGTSSNMARTFTPEARAHLSRKARERWSDPAEREAASKRQKERLADPATREKMSMAKRGRKRVFSESHKEALRNAALRRHAEKRATAEAQTDSPDDTRQNLDAKQGEASDE